MIIEGFSASECWLKALKDMVDNKISEISPFIANIKLTGNTPSYTDDLEKDLNEFLNNAKQPNSQTS